MTKHYIQTEWHRISIEIGHTMEFAPGIDHIEVKSVGRIPLPITETGYRSLFINPEPIAHAGGAESFVLSWLDHEAGGAAWKRYEGQSRQLSLF